MVALYLLLLAGLFSQRCQALFEEKLVSFGESPGALPLEDSSLLIDDQEHVSISIALEALAADFNAVTGTLPEILSVDSVQFEGESGLAIVVGSINGSRLIQELVNNSKLDVSAIEGKYESFTTSLVQDPFPGIDYALVIAGSDNRGTVFGIYTLSEQIGVSPWWWWADVHIEQRESIYALPVVTVHGEPSVKYRGLFINDEAPALTSWIVENTKSQKYDSEFYKKVFELLLRNKANYLWPAMWPSYPSPGNSFFVDDPLNQKTAADYGVVVSTSHHEPMQRATNEWLTSGNGTWDWVKNEKNVTDFFREGALRAQPYVSESYFTIGMRGAGDSGLTGDNPAAILTDVIATQREIFEEVYGDASEVNQVWALYKEVQALYEAGLEIPDDVTLMFSDDNFGSVRRLPTEAERQRSGGTGLYYHLEFVGSPRSYKWLNTNSLGRVWQQLSTARQQGADKIWVINVADIKPMETPLSMIFAMAWNASSFTTVPEFLEGYVAREWPTLSNNTQSEIVDVLLGHSRLNGLRRHEHVESTTYSLLNYNEAERFLGQWTLLTSRVDQIRDEISEASYPSFYQLVEHPIKASQTYYALKVALAKNSQFGWQRRNSANDWAQEALALFDKDQDIREEYHELLHGKWNHIMDQAHYGFTSSWIPPTRDMINGLAFVQTRQKTVPALGQMGVSVEGTSGRAGLFNEGSDLAQPSRGTELTAAVTLPRMEPYGPSSRWFDIFARGPGDIGWFVEAEESFVTISPTSGTLSQGDWDSTVKVEIDWSQVPDGYNTTTIIHVNTTTEGGGYEQVHLPITKTKAPDSFRGFLESDRAVAMEAAHFQSSSSDTNPDVYYQTLPHVGRAIEDSSPGSVGLAPSSGIAPSPDEGGPWLEYDFHLFSTPTSLSVTVSLYFGLTLDTDPDTPLSYSIAFDGGAVNTTLLLSQPATAGDLPSGWTTAIQDLTWRKDHTYKGIGTGAHKIRYWAGKAGILLERIVVNAGGGVRTSYFGPQESVLIS